MRRLVLLAALPVLLLVSASASAAWDGKPFSADVVSSSAGTGGQDMSGKLHVDRPGMRMEQTAQGQQTIILLRFGQPGTTLLMPAEKTYMEMPAGQGGGEMAAQMGEGPCGGYQKATDLGRESLQGRAVEKWRCEAPKIAFMPPVTTIWYDPALQFVILQESGPGDRFELRNIVEGAQPAALFKIPQGYSRMVMPGMTGGQAGAGIMAIDPSQMEGLSEEEKKVLRKAMEEMMKQVQQPQ